MYLIVQNKSSEYLLSFPCCRCISRAHDLAYKTVVLWSLLFQAKTQTLYLFAMCLELETNSRHFIERSL